MIVKVLSDLHLEYFNDYPGLGFFVSPDTAIDVICLCGDIGSPSKPEYARFLLECAEFCSVRTFVIMGNHEAFKMTVSDARGLVEKVCERHEKLTFLNNGRADIGDYRFVGTTLWTRIATADIPRARDWISDFRYISKWSIGERHRAYDENIAWLRCELEHCGDKKLVVLSHHAPMMSLGNPMHEDLQFKSAFAADLRSFIESARGRIVYWFYGHNHYSQSVKMGETVIASNQYGKLREITGFRRDLVYVLENDN